jgi:hypothetical protein
MADYMASRSFIDVPELILDYNKCLMEEKE